jgi:hypothetical protein
MTYVVRREPVSQVFDELLAVLRQTRDGAIDEAWLERRYRESPDGEAALWTLRTEDGALAGYTVCLPRAVLVGGTTLRGWVGADFSILPEYRTLGLALRLRRAARDAIDAGEADLLYAFPNERMRLIHQKVGHVRLGRLVRMVRPVSSRQYVDRMARSTYVGAMVSPIVDAVLSFRTRLVRRGEWETALEREPRFDERFDHLVEQTASQHGAIGRRDSRFLTWRGSVQQTPAGLVTATGPHGLAGYLVFAVEEGSAVVYDALAVQEPGAYENLLAALLREAYRLRLRSVSLTLLEHGGMLTALRALGFVEREEHAEVYVYVPERNAARTSLLDSMTWHVTIWDRDI